MQDIQTDLDERPNVKTRRPTKRRTPPPGPPDDPKGGDKIKWFLIIGGIGGLTFCGCSFLFSISSVEFNFIINALNTIKWQVGLTGIFLFLFWGVIYLLITGTIEKALRWLKLNKLANGVVSLRSSIKKNKHLVFLIGQIFALVMTYFYLPESLPKNLYTFVTGLILNILGGLIFLPWPTLTDEPLSLHTWVLAMPPKALLIISIAIIVHGSQVVLIKAYPMAIDFTSPSPTMTPTLTPSPTSAPPPTAIIMSDEGLVSITVDDLDDLGVFNTVEPNIATVVVTSTPTFTNEPFYEVFVLDFYKVALTYEIGLWQDLEDENGRNILINLLIPGCSIMEQGPTEIRFDDGGEITLGQTTYKLFLSPLGDQIWYLALGYEETSPDGSPLLIVKTEKPNDMQRCNPAAQQVLQTLHSIP